MFASTMIQLLSIHHPTFEWSRLFSFAALTITPIHFLIAGPSRAIKQQNHQLLMLPLHNHMHTNIDHCFFLKSFMCV
jgi:hypothetical protein